MTKRNLMYFRRNPVYSKLDGFHLLAADAVNVNSYLRSIIKAMKGSFFRKPIGPVDTRALAADLYVAYNGRMPQKVCERICQKDMLIKFGVGVTEEGFIFDADEAGLSPTGRNDNEEFFGKNPYMKRIVRCSCGKNVRADFNRGVPKCPSCKRPLPDVLAEP